MPEIAENKRQAGTSQPIAYHLYMRSLLFVLMITLLLMRGWMGDAMATGMALTPLQNQQFATKIIATHTHDMSAEDNFHPESATPEAHHQAQAVHDCAGHAANDASLDSNAHCESCAACLACQTLALTRATTEASPVFSSLRLPRARATKFASAEAARGQKPPIS